MHDCGPHSPDIGPECGPDCPDRPDMCGHVSRGWGGVDG